MKDGYLRLGRLGGVPLRVHAVTPLGLFVLAGFRFEPGLWLGILVVLVVHELGHALVARVRGRRVRGIDVHPIGGVCRVDPGSELDEAAIAWGGVLAQGWLRLVVELVLFARPQLVGNGIAAGFVYGLTSWSLFVAAINLIPFEPLDGAKAWKLFAHLGWFRRAPRIVSIDPEKDAAETVREALERAKRDATR